MSGSKGYVECEIVAGVATCPHIWLHSSIVAELLLFDELEYASVSYKELASFDVQTHSLAELIAEYKTRPSLPICTNFKCEKGKAKFYSREYLGHYSPKNARQGLGGECMFCRHALYWTRKYDDLDDETTELRYRATLENRIKAGTRSKTMHARYYQDNFAQFHKRRHELYPNAKKP